MGRLRKMAGGKARKENGDGFQFFIKVSFAGCSKMSRCKAPEILSREAYSLVR
jgi:hypothetical protein